MTCVSLKALRIRSGHSFSAMAIIAAGCLGLQGPALGQSALAEGDVQVDSVSVGGELGVPLSANNIDVGRNPSSPPNAFGRLTVSGGGAVTTNILNAGDQQDTTGILAVTGIGSSVTTNGPVLIGRDGFGVVDIRDGGAVIVGGSAEFGEQIFSPTFGAGVGNLTVAGTGSKLDVWNSLNLFSGSGLVDTGGRIYAGQLQIADGFERVDLDVINGRVEVDGNIRLGSNGVLRIASSGHVVSQSLVVRSGSVVSMEGGDLVATQLGIELNPGGALTGYGDLTGRIMISEGAPAQEINARLGVDAGETMRVYGEIDNFGQIDNRGELDFADNELSNRGSYIGQDSTVRGLMLNNISGTIDFIAGLNVIDVELINREPSRVSLTGGANAVFTQDVNNRGQIRVEQGSHATFLSDVSGSGTFDGTGQVVFLGTYSPGDSPGLVTFGGDLTMGASSTTRIELGGLARGAQYDASDVAGKLTLGAASQLEITVIDGFALTHGDTFKLIEVGISQTGTFSNAGQGESVGLFGSIGLLLDYAGGDGNDVVAYAVQGGDLNGDDKVSFADFNTLANNYNGPTSGLTWAQGDFTGDGDVAFADFNILANNYGFDANEASAAAQADIASVAPGEAKLIVGLDGSLAIEGGNVDLNGFSILSASGMLILDADGNAAPFSGYLSNTAEEIAAVNIGTTTNIDGQLLLDVAIAAGDVSINDLVFEYGTQAGSIQGVVEVVPEPSSLALLGLGGLLLLRRNSAHADRRRRG